METTDYGELFGVSEQMKEYEEQQRAKEQEVTDPAAEAGANEQEVTDPAVDSNDVEPDEDGEPSEPEVPYEDADTDDQPAAGEGETPPKSKQSTEQNAQFAAARRKAEQDAREQVRQAKEQAEKELNSFIASLGLIDPATQQPITNRAAYDAYRQQQTAQQRSSIARKAGLSDDQMNDFVSNQPEVIAAQAAMSRIADMEFKATVARDLAEIAKFDPTVKSSKDIVDSPTFGEVQRIMNDKRCSLSEAWKLANFDRLTAARAARARQEERNSTQSLGHLKPTQARGGGLEEVPSDVMQEYRRFSPDATDEKIRLHYNKTLGKA